MKDYIKQKLRRIGQFINRDELTYVTDCSAVAQLPDLGMYIPWTDSAMRPAAVRKVLNEILVNQRRSLIEFGSGISTVYSAIGLRDTGGFGLSVEHNATWAEIVTRYLRQLGLDDVIQIVNADLVQTEHQTTPWYDPTILRESIGDRRFDLVVVDGPPAYTRPLSRVRYAALPFMRPHLESDYCVFLDDASRFGEAAVLKRWSKEDGIRIVIDSVNGNIGIGRPHQTRAFTI